MRKRKRKLKMTSKEKRYVYLAGKIKIGHSATEYRSLVAPILLTHGFHSLDPLRGKYTMESWNSLVPNEIVTRDLRDIDKADLVLAVNMQCKESSFGTPCEIMYAWLQHKPIIFITDEKYLANHFWVRSLCSRIFLIEDGHTINDTLVKVANYIGEWFGPNAEQEIYKTPKLKITTGCKCKSLDDCKCTRPACDCPNDTCQFGCLDLL